MTCTLSAMIAIYVDDQECNAAHWTRYGSCPNAPNLCQPLGNGRSAAAVVPPFTTRHRRCGVSCDVAACQSPLELVVPPEPSSSVIALRMRRQKRSRTRPELAVRQRLHCSGLRFRVNYPPLVSHARRRADIVFTRWKVAVFVDGCFWHGCPVHGTWPKANAVWWREKIKSNKKRDQDTNTALVASGWMVLRIWEHVPPDEAAATIAKALDRRRRGRS
jgi:DNA mismatch endonuclease, patch repair protein